MTFHEILNQELQKQNISQRELANRTDVTEVSISRYCKGQRSPNADTIAKIVDELHVNADYLLGRESVESVTIQDVIQQLDGSGVEMSERTVEYIKKCSKISCRRNKIVLIFKDSRLILLSFFCQKIPHINYTEKQKRKGD